jgi:hypothetical protein
MLAGTGPGCDGAVLDGEDDLYGKPDYQDHGQADYQSVSRIVIAVCLAAS